MAPADPVGPYQILDADGVRGFLATLPDVRALLGAEPHTWRVREVGDGNLNLVFIVEGASGSVCVKQAVPYVRVAGPAWPMTPQRIFFEQAYYRAVAPFVGSLIPRVYHYEPALYCLVMERLAPHIILRQGLIAGRRYPHLGRALGEFVARAAFFTSDFARPFEHKMQAMALFAGNTALVRITVDLIFTDPYLLAPRNRHTSPQLDDYVGELRRDLGLKLAAARFGEKFLTDAQALVHGDLHSGSVMVTEQDTRVIDPEFAFIGPIGFDLGAFFGNLLLSYYAQPGHATAADDRRRYQDWVLEQARIFWITFRSHMLALFREHANGDLLPASMFSAPAEQAALECARCEFVDGLFADMLGFAACKMIRRILGFAHVIDFERIVDPVRRAGCEQNALAMARLLLTQPQRFASIEAVLETVPQIAASPA
jgi:5-methylthioribose kinase